MPASCLRLSCHPLSSLSSSTETALPCSQIDWIWEYEAEGQRGHLPRKLRQPPAVEPRTQLPWWTVTSHLWRVLSSRASGVRLQISTLSKWALKSSNAILRQRQGRVIGRHGHGSSCLHGQPPNSLPGEGDTPGVPPRRMEAGRKTKEEGRG